MLFEEPCNGAHNHSLDGVRLQDRYTFTLQTEGFVCSVVRQLVFALYNTHIRMAVVHFILGLDEEVALP